MTAYPDTSFLISLYGSDVNSPDTDAVVRVHRPVFLVTAFGESEFANACEFRVYLRQWTPAKAHGVYDRFLSHLSSGIFQSQEITLDVWRIASSLSRRHTAKIGARSLDVIHVASALAFKPDVFCTFDERQRKLAQAEGLRVLPA